MRGRVALAVVLALLLAGCMVDEAPDEAPNDDSLPINSTGDSIGSSKLPEAGRASGIVTAIDCRLNPFVFQAEGDTVAEQVPAPYRTGDSTIESLGLEVYACGAIVLDNETVLRDASFAWAIIPVEPPEEWAGAPGTHHVFMTEFFAPEAMAQPLANLGLDAIVAIVTTVETEGVEATVEVEDQMLYEAVGYGRSNQEVSQSGILRLHYAAGDGFGWIDANATMALASLGDTVHLAASGGTLHDVSPTTGHLIGRSTPGSYSSVWTFGGPQDGP